MGKKIVMLALWLLAAMAVFPGCDKETAAPPVKISLLTGNARAVPLDEAFTIRVQAMAAPRRTALGGMIDTPAAGARVTVKTVSIPVRDVRLPESVLTASDGQAAVKIPGLNVPGVYHFTAQLADYPQIKPLDIYIYAGLIITGDAQDGWVGRMLHEPLTITAQKVGGMPAENVELVFDIRNAPAGTALLSNKLTTEDKTGEANLSIKMGKAQGRGVVGMRVLSPPWKTDADVPDLQLTFFTVDPWNLLLGVAGGLAIFIFGMRQMSDGLTLIAGEKLRNLLHSLTRNRFAAVGMGIAITGFIQSSSACSVMAIGFVNAALMTLEQAIGVIIGANIGTTVTAQMISFKLEALAYPAVAIGVVYSLITKNTKGRFLAQILIGFGLLFLGMQLMGAPLGELRHSQFIRSIFSYLDCTPVDGIMPFSAVCKAVFAGMFMTIVMQSSSAFIGVLLALAAAGLIDVYTSFAVLLGSNIGTTITAVIASIGSTVAAKRVACAHVIFNLAGTILITSTLYITWHGQPAFMVLINQITPGNIFNNENLVRFLANAHTVFNIACACIFIFIIGSLAALTRLIISGDETAGGASREAQLLDPHLVAMPSLAISLAWREISVMVKKGRDAFFPSLRAIFDCDGKDDHNFEKLTEDVKQLEIDVDNLQSSITGYVSNITIEALMTERQGAALPNILHSVNDAERVSDHAMHLIRLAKRSHKHTLRISPEAVNELSSIEVALHTLFDNCARIIEERPTPQFLVEESHSLVKKMHKMINDASKAHLERQEKGVCDVRSGAIYQELLYNLHRIGSHLNNIIKAASSDTDSGNYSGQPLANKSTARIMRIG